MEVLFTTKVPIFDCNHLAKYNYSVFCKRRLVSIVNKQWTHPPRNRLVVLLGLDASY